MRGRSCSSFTMSITVGSLSRGELDCDLTRSWWSQTESNRRHPACKAGALPTELWPLSGSNTGELSTIVVAGPAGLVGPGRLELPTSRLSGVRSNHLSYGPRWHTPEDPSARSGERTLTHEYVACEERETKAASVPHLVCDQL